jgi:DNA-binding LacI/PurR family transcriptional regulator
MPPENANATPQPFASIYDLAKQAGVSASTVSRVLNQRGRIAASTRNRVLATARAAGFRPRMTARQITIAVAIDRNQYATFGGFVSCLLSNLVQVLSRHDVGVELFTEHNLNQLQSRFIDGVLAMAWDDTTIEALRQLRDVPVVTLNRMDVPEFSSVATDHRRDGVMAVDYLAERGHRRIVMISEEQDNWGAQQRVEGFLHRLRELGLPTDDASVAFTEHQPTYGLLRRLMMLHPRPTGLFLAGENLGPEATYILRDVLGVKVPGEVSIIGMESPQVSQFLCPPLTTLCQPLDELAARALELVLEQIQTRQMRPVQVILNNRYIERESVATLATGNEPTANPLSK